MLAGAEVGDEGVEFAIEGARGIRIGQRIVWKVAIRRGMV